MPGSAAARTDPWFKRQWPGYGGLARWVALATVSGVLAAGCTSLDDPPDAGTRSPTVQPEQSGSPEASENGQPEIEFLYQPPDLPCPPVSALSEFPPADDHSYVLSRSYLNDGEELHESIRTISARCRYEPDIVTEDETVVLLDDHLILIVEMVLFRSWAESFWPDAIREFPLASEDLRDWVPDPEGSLRHRGVWREGCEPEAAGCAENGNSAAVNYVWYMRRQGHVGNLQFELTVHYVTEEPRSDLGPPSGAPETVVAIMREFVLTVVDSWEQVN